jgi:uncharacterized protein YndB with AHSA1/START domain
MEGTYEKIDGRPAVRFERRLAHPIEAVWRAVTEPDELAAWFPTRVEVDLRVGGAMRFTFVDHEHPEMRGEVLELDPPRRFAFTWGDDEEVQIELEPADGGAATLLHFVQLLGAENTAARNAAGWHVCLQRLTTHLAGGDGDAPDWGPIYQRYIERGVPSGAEIPGQA